jgi:hypothetical protein
MKSTGLFTILVSLMLLVGCGSDSSDLRSYLIATDRSGDVMQTLANELVAWRHENEPLIGTEAFSFDEARAFFRQVVESMEREQAKVTALEVPAQAAEFHQSLLSFYQHNIAMYGRQSEVMDVLEQINILRGQPNPDQTLAQQLLDRYEAIQQDLESLAERSRVSARESTAGRERLGASL